ncbi:TetR/AcrR family transcriptional regulator [Lentilactobacillus buchneri]|uniref:Transcriptional regulator, TetR family n=1 Tax=Lentilactobacillus buchneri subsp. silagei CD034 TaxID=1071400 RepID=J9W0I0_LENBU|nr:TetR/AcrR family transcriptional regulator [Lentilactobacillus buchneri]MCC6102124.1 TetR/AcrR family transcriptional regulator [Lactobacillus sp.]AFR99908.1 transcriptional regulator, TetR family [Lentilactobacillus buchneri subsp. silagei CD034]MCT2901422.1 TetR family transcriptional regulator [Lentilactobacillus buchneri]MCT3541806.1 TetR family transcriptional regulator [Lentilactobacillus buchneri]MCT3545127.1 TetR family transcriptional regulator [Lentilactobacillus buchneri]
MKYDLTKKPTRGAQRTLESFSTTMIALLSKEPFEKISVNEICAVSNFPRATFYNYFDDKFDLAAYCWYVIAQEIEVDQATELKADRTLITYFDRLYDVFKNNQTLLDNVLQYNDFSGQLVNSFINYFKNKLQEILTKSIDYSKAGLPVELIVDHCSQTVVLVLKWIFLKHHDADKQQAHEYLEKLLNIEHFI